ncbi:hypothetical protein E2C01_064833 [Portunus trituberculatus]|uniref:Uncharacterized protein n=1 Tax=Portunus trituberculatus TaxID=210409 RepID=A0A5B7HCV9_PORTR|nr:hypothetical protein [Portunus trituberculatus]
MSPNVVPRKNMIFLMKGNASTTRLHNVSTQRLVGVPSLGSHGYFPGGKHSPVLFVVAARLGSRLRTLRITRRSDSVPRGSKGGEDLVTVH